MQRLRTHKAPRNPPNQNGNQVAIRTLIILFLAFGNIFKTSENLELAERRVQQTSVEVVGIDDESTVVENVTASSPDSDERVEKLPETRMSQSKEMEDGTNATSDLPTATTNTTSEPISISTQVQDDDTNATSDLPTAITNTTSAPISNSSKVQEVNLDDPLAAWSNLTTKAYCCGGFYSGFRNQIMVFTGIVFNAQSDGIGQILLNSLLQKDTYGSNKHIPFERLWDVPHWNSHYPALPRLVHYDPVLHDQFDLKKRHWYTLSGGNWTDRERVNVYKERTRPYPSWKQPHLFGAYHRYANGRGPFPIEGGHRRPAEKLMLTGAMRPHPKLREIIELCQQTMTSHYMTLHARVEPDMQKHVVCRDRKVLKLREIFDFIEKKWPQPPVKRIFIPINREYLEKEGSNDYVSQLNAQNRSEEINWIAVENLNVLNEARHNGLWGGKVKVVEFGEKVLKDTEYSDTPSTTAALVNFFISIGAKIFIGTEVSSYSHDLLATRFFLNDMENYKYLPDGLHHWTPPGLVDPPGHQC